MGERYDFPADIDTARARLVELQNASQDLQTNLNERVIEDDDGVPLRGHAYTEARRRLVDEWNEVNVELRGLKLHIKSLDHARRSQPAGAKPRASAFRLIDRLVAVHTAGGDTQPLLAELAATWEMR